ncbi:hypothetical protein DND132_1128 [Pseudodesulfovibrio mercurii]|uniref:Thiamine biosynthesis protein ThiS n=1 Tax=Pseudodesulfovibrio mercurii TaxID=641491 RepID=F0JBU8_9BACT|nr:hypothetical protein [Pseudodesulfovibrio mercurii]EGB14341.1 hypothetical protein DND132_1128 [Pseudodesulfovibrio mercurii]
MIIVNLEPDGKRIELNDTRSVLAVLNKLQLRPTMALVARRGELLTPDRSLVHGDELLVRKVTSAG